MTYSGEHLFKLATAFELIGLGQPALTASTLVESNWPSIAAGYGIAVRNEFHEWPHDKKSSNILIYLRITLNTLSPLLSNSEDGAESGHVSVEYRRNLIEYLEDDPEREGNSFLLLCASHIMRGVLHACKDARVKDPFDDPEFAEWYKRDGSYGWWMFGEGNQLVNVPDDQHS
ncbi:hypothetical protein Sphch_3160 [Sphingobium chlorophenolicum L-1]|uniref:Uncharacterized protein n=2 Tax=Sphingobium chlorophenolicum TaxID=46429 RepID=F6F2W3_SPHCR|nr:hypothetical protein Sphch_3160 [Sphingobium chlorophenolicum L-1]